MSCDIIVDGVLVKVRDYLWIVKGCYHPRNHVIALPRYGLDNTKIKEFDESYRIAREYGFILFDENLDMSIPAIPLNLVEYCLNPFNNDPRHLGVLGEKAWRLKQLIAEYGGIDLEYIGVTGSLLAKKVLPGLEVGDIDIIVRGREESIKAYRALRKLRANGILSSINSPVYRELEIQDPKTRLELMRKRVLEGLFDKTPYSIRLIPCLKQTEKTSRIKRLGWWTGTIEIVEPIQSYIMPYQYKIKVIGENSSQKPRVLISYRMRFSELPRGLILWVKGILEYHVDEGVLKLCPDHPGSKTRIQETTT